MFIYWADIITKTTVAVNIPVTCLLKILCATILYMWKDEWMGVEGWEQYAFVHIYIMTQFNV